MGAEDTLVSTVSRAVGRTVAGFLAAGALGLGGVAIAVGPGLLTSVAAGDVTAWDLGRAQHATQHVTQPATRAERVQRQVQRLGAGRDCTAHGFGGDTIPASAIVQVRGRAQLVSFDQGWATYTGERPGRLLAVCRI